MKVVEKDAAELDEAAAEELAAAAELDEAADELAAAAELDEAAAAKELDVVAGELIGPREAKNAES